MEGEYYKTKESVEEYIRLAKGISGKELIEELLKVLPPHSALLEIGTGPGTDWNILQQSYKVTGSDNSAKFLNHLHSENPNNEFLELDATSLKTDRKFDGIYSNKVLHHLKDDELVVSVKRQSEILLPNGIICHSFWRGNGSEIFKGLFVNYHQGKTLREVFSTYFEVLSVQSYQEFDKDDSLLLLARRK